MNKMKQIITTFAFCALCAGANAQTVTVADVEALPGETVAFVLNLTGGKADTYTAMQFDAHFPSTDFTTTGKYSISELWENATANIGSVDADGTATIPVASSETINAADVDRLLSVSFTVGSDMALGEYDVTLTNLWFGYGTSSKDYLDDVTFKVKVVNVHTVVLDEASTEMPSAATGVDVRVKRTIKAGEWSTICLPFAMTEAQVKTAFGDDVQLGDFQGYDVKDDGETIGVKFADVTAIEKNHPYIIKVGADVAEFTVDGVDVDPEEEPMINFGTKRKPKAFVGNYVAGTAIDNGCLFLSDNKFWYSVGTTTIKGFRGYFNFDDLLPDFEDNYAEARVMMMFDDDDVVTGIDASLSSKGEHRYYNLGGQRISHPKKKGLYIQEGKKLIVK